MFNDVHGKYIVHGAHGKASWLMRRTVDSQSSFGTEHTWKFRRGPCVLGKSIIDGVNYCFFIFCIHMSKIYVIYIYTRIYIYIYSHTHTHMYIYIYTYIYIYISPNNVRSQAIYIYIPVVSPLYPHVISHSIPLSFLYIQFFFKVDTHKYSISQYINMSHCKYQSSLYMHPIIYPLYRNTYAGKCSTCVGKFISNMYSPCIFPSPHITSQSTTKHIKPLVTMKHCKSWGTMGYTSWIRASASVFTASVGAPWESVSTNSAETG